MSEIKMQRLEADIQEPFVVFIIGFRINKYWKIHKWLSVQRAFKAIHKELDTNPDIGCMGYEIWSGRVRLSIQYWRSYDELITYARDKSAAHFPAWFEFNSTVSRDGDVGLWHEVYMAKPGTFKAVYKNMPPFGLGRATQLASKKVTKIVTTQPNL
ncbi:MAG: DUF4188 domain-containing protein [Gammaproteobacteria bacterium]|nr:DUF4188 domain-containing protein [Gammaproteobacteria bacterium]